MAVIHRVEVVVPKSAVCRLLNACTLPSNALLWLFALGFILLAPIAQANTGVMTVSYASAGPGTADGYENALVQVKYSLMVCPGGAITIAVERVKGSVIGSPGYWFEGSRVPASASLPQSPLVPFSGTVLHGATKVGSFSVNAGDALGFGCFSGDTHVVGKLSDHLGKGATKESIDQFIMALSVRPDTAREQLRNEGIARAVRADRQKARQQAEAVEREKILKAERQRKAAAEAQKTKSYDQKITPTGDSFSKGTELRHFSETSSSPVSGAVKNASDYVRSSDGGYYRKDSSGQYQPISAQEYNDARAQAAEARNAPAQSEVRQRADDELSRVVAEQDRRRVAIENTNQAVERQAQNSAESFYAARAASQARENIKGLTQLNGNYTSVEELEADFWRQTRSLDQEMKNLEQANRQQVEAATQLYFGDSDPQVGAFMSSLGHTLNNHARQKEKEEANRKLYEQRQRLEQQIVAKRKSMIIAKRRNLLTAFPEGDVPLSSHKVNADTLYFFAYALNQADIESERPQVVTTHTFPVHRNGVGMWPFKYSIEDELATGPGESRLVGYYATQALAERMRGSFLKLAKDSGFAVKEVAYAGPSPKSPARETASTITNGHQVQKSLGGVADEKLWGPSTQTTTKDDIW